MSTLWPIETEESDTRTLVNTLPLRERPAWRVTYQADGCSIVELLAAIIGGARQIEAAQDIIARFGSVQGLARATCEEVAEVDGIGQATAARMQAALEIGRRLSSSLDEDIPAISTPDAAANLLLYRMQDLDQERLVVLLLDSRNHLIGEPVEVYHGSLNTTLIRIGEVLRPAVRANAAAILVAHNHPSGDPTPSADDVAVTRAIVKAGKMLDIDVHDHIVIGRGRFVSLKSRGLGFEKPNQ